MDTFDLKWPQTDATFYTDGWRCRIVWREKRGGLGGTIENNEQAKKRVANSLLTAPYLLSALRARGHGLLAEEIAAIADDDVLQSAQPSAQKSSAPAGESASGAEAVTAWLARLEGSADFEEVTGRRAKVWQPCAELADERLLLKAPAPKGKCEWVIKRDFADAGRKAAYVAAADLRGICRYLHQRGVLKDPAAVEDWLMQVEALDHDALAQAATLWREVSNAATH